MLEKMRKTAERNKSVNIETVRKGRIDILRMPENRGM